MSAGYSHITTVSHTKDDGFVKKAQYLRLRAIHKNFTHAQYAAFEGTRQSLILNLLQSRRIATFYVCITVR